MILLLPNAVKFYPILTYQFLLYRHFKNVVDLCIKQVQRIPKYQRVLYWHHCLLHMAHYLLFTPL